MLRLMYYGELRDMTGLRSEDVDAGPSLGSVFRYISRTHGKEAGKSAKRGLITVNGKRAGTRTEKLGDGSVICFFPVCIGG